MALPIILEGGAATDAGQRAPDSAGTYFELELWTTSGLDFGYSVARSAVYRTEVAEAAWRYDRIGGADGGEFVLEGGIADLDTAIQLQYELRAVRQGVIWYRGRITAYEHFTTPDGVLRTRIRTEGYQTKLAEIRVNRTISSGQTVSQAVTTIYDNDIKTNSRIRSESTAIVGSYALAGNLVFDCTAFEALRTLALLQGTAEWGVAESGQLYFHQEVQTATQTGHVILGQKAPEMRESGSFQRAYNRVVAYGQSFVTATANNAAAQTTYGVRELKVHFPWVVNAATDLQRIADNICTTEKDGHSRLYGELDGPTERIEDARVNPSATIPAQKKLTFRGVDGTSTTEHFVKIEYTYRHSSPEVRFYAKVWAGAAEESLVRELYRLRTRVDGLFEAASDITGSNHNVLSATHSDTVAASVVKGDIVVGNSTPKWTRLPVGTNTQVLTADSAEATGIKWAAAAGGTEAQANKVLRYLAF